MRHSIRALLRTASEGLREAPHHNACLHRYRRPESRGRTCRGRKRQLRNSRWSCRSSDGADGIGDELAPRRWSTTVLCRARRGVLSVAKGNEVSIATRKAVTSDDLEHLEQGALAHVSVRPEPVPSALSPNSGRSPRLTSQECGDRLGLAGGSLGVVNSWK